MVLTPDVDVRGVMITLLILLARLGFLCGRHPNGVLACLCQRVSVSQQHLDTYRCEYVEEFKTLVLYDDSVTLLVLT